MGCTVDHLSLHRRVKVIREFTDAARRRHGVGETGVITRIELDWPGQQINIKWDCEGILETLAFDLGSTSGPGNGRMRDYFEALDLAIPNDLGKHFVEGLGLVSILPPHLSPLTTDFIDDPSHHEAALNRVRALAGLRRFAEADEQLQAVSTLSQDRLAASLAAAAEHHAFDPQAGIYEWLRDQAINHWYAWGAQATSGGDGAARLLEIYPVMERFNQLDQARASLGLATDG